MSVIVLAGANFAEKFGHLAVDPYLLDFMSYVFSPESNR
jgi:hypothetical protein